MTLNQWSPEKASASRASCAAGWQWLWRREVQHSWPGVPPSALFDSPSGWPCRQFSLDSKRRPSHPRGSSPRGTGLVLSNGLDVHLRGLLLEVRSTWMGRKPGNLTHSWEFPDGKNVHWPASEWWHLEFLPHTLFLQGTEDSTWVGWKTGHSDAD